MLLTDYPSIKREDLSDYAKKSIWMILHAYMDVYSQILIYGYPGDELHSILIYKYQCVNMNLSEKSDTIHYFSK